MAAEFPAAYLQVKVEPSDSEYLPNVDDPDFSDDENDNSQNFERARWQLSTITTPSLRRQTQREQEQVLKQTKQELEHAHNIISEQLCQLEKSEKKITELQESIHHQEELLMRTEADHATDKAIAQAENDTLRKLLEQERKRRVFSEQRLQKFAQSRKSVQSFRQRPAFQSIFNSLPSTSRLIGTRNVGGSGGGIDIMEKSKLDYTPSQVSTSRFQTNFFAAEANGDNTDDDDVVVVNVIEKQANRTRPVRNWTKNEQQSQCAKSRFTMPEKSQYPNRTKNCSVFPCNTCGLTFNAGWKLISHVQCHRIQSNLGKINKQENATHLSQVTKSPLQGEVMKSSPNVMIGTQPQSSLKRNRRGKKFRCTLCESRFAIVSQLKMHQKKVHGIVDDKFSIGCRECGKIFNTRKQHVKHRRVVHGTMYSKGWKERSSQQHNQRSSSPASVTTVAQPALPASTTVQSSTPGTSKTFSIKSQPIKMSKSEHGIGTQNARAGWFCLCGRSFMTLLTLNEHVRHYTNEHRHICQICGKKFTGLQFLNLHILQTHVRKCTVTKRIAAATKGDIINVPSISPNVDNNDCQTTTSSEPELTQNSQESTSNCDNLCVAAANQSRQQHHLVGEDPKVLKGKYACSCGREYLSRSSFNVHARCKNKGRIFNCSLCPRRFDQHGNLKSHVQMAHKLKYTNGRYGCGNCAQTFETSALLVRHRFYLCKYRNNKKDKVVQAEKLNKFLN